MVQRTSGWRSLLSLPGVYSFCQNLVGSARSRQEMIEKYIRPEQGIRILDLGCGPAAILDDLPDSVYYVGVDLSKEYIDAARQKYGNRGTFYCLPVESMEVSGLSGFNLVMGLGVLHHLDDSQARRFFAVAAKALKENGRCLTVDPCLVPGQHPAARLLIRMDRGQHVRTVKGYAALAESAFSKIAQDIRHDILRVPYTHNIMESAR